MTNFNALIKNASPFLASSLLYWIRVLLNRSWNSWLSLGFSGRYSSSWTSVGFESIVFFSPSEMMLYFMSGRRAISLFGEDEREADSRFRDGITVSMSESRVVHCAGVK